jgi:hypothetical protein
MSRRAMMGGVAVAALLGAVGCSDSTDVATGPRYLTNGPTTSACNITQTKADARAYFPNGLQTTVQALIKTLGDQYTAGNFTGATTTGFDIMKYIADAHRNGTVAGTAQNGSSLTNDLIGCMSVGVVPTPIDFAAALGPQGGYEVRGGPADAVTPVGALGKKSALQAPGATVAAWNTWVGRPRPVLRSSDLQQLPHRGAGRHPRLQLVHHPGPAHPHRRRPRRRVRGVDRPRPAREEG